MSASTNRLFNSDGSVWLHLAKCVKIICIIHAASFHELCKWLQINIPGVRWSCCWVWLQSHLGEVHQDAKYRTIKQQQQRNIILLIILKKSWLKFHWWLQIQNWHFTWACNIAASQRYSSCLLEQQILWPKYGLSLWLKRQRKGGGMRSWVLTLLRYNRALFYEAISALV